MVIKNNSNFGASLTSLGDGSDSSFWRKGGAWSSGTPTSTAVPITTAYNNPLASIPSYTGPNTAPAGFLTYLILFSFGETGTLPSASTQVSVSLALDVANTKVITSYQIGYMTTTQAASFSGAYIYNAPDTLPFSPYLFVKIGTAPGSQTATMAFGSITVIGIN